MIRIIILFIAIAMITAESSPGQEFWFGGTEDDHANAITRTSDGCYVVAGWTESHGGNKPGGHVLKLDPTGSLVWEHRHSDLVSESLWDVIPTLYGGCVVAGRKGVVGITAGNALVAELDEDGQPEWVRVHGRTGESEAIRGITHANGGGYVVAGYISLPGMRGVWGPAAAKLNEVGEGEWMWVIEDGSFDELEAVVPASNGGYVAAGVLKEGTEDRALAIKLTQDGTVEWMKTYDLGYGGHVYGICSSVNDGYILAGKRFEEDLIPGDAFLLNIDDEGNEIWREYYGGNDIDAGLSVIKSRQDGYLFVGYTSIPTGTNAISYQRQAWAVKVDEYGTVEEEWLFGGPGSDNALDVVHAWGGGYVLTGWTTSYGAGGKDVYVVMFGSHSSR